MASHSPMVALVLDKIRKGGAAKAKPGMDEGEGDDGAQSAAEEILGAIHDEDPKALAAALKSYVQACMDNYDAGE